MLEVKLGNKKVGVSMNFGEAVEFLKQGRVITRQCDDWNGKYIYLSAGSEVSAYQLRAEVKQVVDWFGSIDACDPFNTVTIHNRIDSISTTEGIRCGWYASSEDILANDWYVEKHPERNVRPTEFEAGD